MQEQLKTDLKTAPKHWFLIRWVNWTGLIFHTECDALQVSGEKEIVSFHGSFQLLEFVYTGQSCSKLLDCQQASGSHFVCFGVFSLEGRRQLGDLSWAFVLPHLTFPETVVALVKH